MFTRAANNLFGSFLQLASSGSQGNSNEGFWTGEVVAAFTAAGVALIAAIVTVIVQLRMSRRQQAHETRMAEKQRAHEMSLDSIARSFSMRQQEIDWRVRQMNDFYGPLRVLRAVSKRLRLSLPSTEPNGERWRLVRHIPEVKAHSGHKVIAEAIIKINGAIEDLLITKAGLMEGGQLHESFAKFMHHSRLLRLAWEADEDLITEPGLIDISDIPFPYEIDDDIAEAIDSINAGLRKARSEMESS